MAFKIAGIYLFTLKYMTRTCGVLSLCGPTTVAIVRNGDFFKKFSTNVASQKTHDLDLVMTSTLHRLCQTRVLQSIRQIKIAIRVK